MNEISKIIDKLGISRAKFCRICSIPYRTVEDWVTEKRKPRKYVIDLINFRCSKTIYATTHYYIKLSDSKKGFAENIDELKMILQYKAHEPYEHYEDFEVADILSKYSDVNRYPYIKTSTWAVKENLIGEYKYSVYDDNSVLIFRSNDLYSAVYVAHVQAVK